MSRWRGITAWRPDILIEAPEVTSPSDEVPDGVNGLRPKLRPLDRSVDPIDDSQQDFFANGPHLAGLIQQLCQGRNPTRTFLRILHTFIRRPAALNPIIST